MVGSSSPPRATRCGFGRISSALGFEPPGPQAIAAAKRQFDRQPEPPPAPAGGAELAREPLRVGLAQALFVVLAGQ